MNIYKFCSFDSKNVEKQTVNSTICGQMISLLLYKFTPHSWLLLKNVDKKIKSVNIMLIQ